MLKTQNRIGWRKFRFLCELFYSLQDSESLTCLRFAQFSKNADRHETTATTPRQHIRFYKSETQVDYYRAIHLLILRDHASILLFLPVGSTGASQWLSPPERQGVPNQSKNWDCSGNDKVAFPFCTFHSHRASCDRGVCHEYIFGCGFCSG